MSARTTLDRVAAVLREQLMLEEDHPITLESRLVEDLGCDSLDRIQLSMDVEDEFGIEIPYEDVDKVKTVGDLVALVETKLQQVTA
jgi:acyl carrier protein